MTSKTKAEAGHARLTRASTMGSHGWHCMTGGSTASACDASSSPDGNSTPPQTALSGIVRASPRNSEPGPSGAITGAKRAIARPPLRMRHAQSAPSARRSRLRTRPNPLRPQRARVGTTLPAGAHHGHCQIGLALDAGRRSNGEPTHRAGYAPVASPRRSACECFTCDESSSSRGGSATPTMRPPQ